MIDREQVTEWVALYERAWREDDVYAVERLFAPDAHYRRSPYEPADVGQVGIKSFWLEDSGRPFTFAAEIVAVEAEIAVVRVEVAYAGDDPQEYTNLWVMRFAGDQRVEDFEEWPFWPGRPYAASAGSA